MKKYNHTEGNLYLTPTNDPIPSNPSGIKPMGYRIMLHCPPIEEVTQGGIIKPHEYQDKESMRVTKGTIIDMGSRAFEEFPEKPEIGDEVFFKAYNATNAVDGGEYRYISDADILGVKHNG